METTIKTATGSAQANLIFDANGNRKVDDGEIVETAFSSFSSGSVVTLPEGQYYLQVQPRFMSDRLEYDLKMVAKPNPGNLGKQGGGDSLKKPRAIGTLDRLKAGTFVGKDYIGTLDEADGFKFNLKDISSVEMLLEGQGSTQAELIFDANRTQQANR
ncbi:MAG: hypothetical protein IGR76_09965 [Synechococcales cyanobacterium T60_A2020_003]|nr:hypothetical protein [Synechococcales cyanobacterium T60_A2020_003]